MMKVEKMGEQLDWSWKQKAMAEGPRDRERENERKLDGVTKIVQLYNRPNQSYLGFIIYQPGQVELFLINN